MRRRAIAWIAAWPLVATFCVCWTVLASACPFNAATYAAADHPTMALTIYQSPAPGLGNSDVFRATMTNEAGEAIELTIARFLGVGVWTAYFEFLGSPQAVNVVDLNADFTRHSPLVAMESTTDGTMRDAPAALYMEGLSHAVEMARMATFFRGASGVVSGVSADKTRTWDKAGGVWVLAKCRTN